VSRRTKVFLSYARADASDLVQSVRSFLAPAGSDAWVDVHDIPAGTDWRTTLDTEIRDCDAMVLILTPKALGSVEVRKEVDAAFEYQKTIIPLLFEQAAAPDWLGRTQYIEFKQLDDHVALGKLIGDVKKVWDDVERELQSARLRVPDELTPLIDHLELTILAALPRPPVHPEVVHACIEVATRMTKDVGARQLGELIAEWRTGAYVTDTWQTYRTHQREATPIRKILEQAFKNVKVPQIQAVPFVLVVMTHDEAAALESGEALDGASQGFKVLFDQTRARLAGVPDWTSHYAAKREDWYPFGRRQPTVRQLVETELRQWQPPVGTTTAAVLRPQFIDVTTLNADRAQLARLRSSGCVVIVDRVSICHPALLTEYRRTMLDLFPSTLLLNVGAGPYDPADLGAHTVTVPFVQRVDSFFFERLTVELDEHCATAGATFELQKFIREKVFRLLLQDPEGIRSFRRGRA
jgi:hypothetical protein